MLRDLTICGACEEPFVIPIMDECESINEPFEGWRLVLYCPNCGDERCDEVSQKQADAFDYDLDRLNDQLVKAYAKVARENIAHEATRFFKALALDLYTADDFRIR